MGGGEVSHPHPGQENQRRRAGGDFGRGIAVIRGEVFDMTVTREAQSPDVPQGLDLIEKLICDSHGVTDLNASKAAQDDYRRMSKELGYTDTWKSIGQLARDILDRMGKQ